MKGKEARKRWVIAAKVAMGLVVLAAALLFLKSRKEALIAECTHLLESSLSQSSDLRVHIGKIHSNVFGFMSFEDVAVDEPWLPSGSSMLFRAKTIRFRYRFLDFFAKKFDSQLVVTLQKPEVFWRPYIGLRKPEFPFFRWLRQWAISQERHLAIDVENLSFFMGYEQKELKGITLKLDKTSFELEVPVTHQKMGPADVSTLVHVEGHFLPGYGGRDDLLTGKITTQGTVIDWKPLAYESEFDFWFTEEYFLAQSPHFLGGVDTSVQINFTRDYEVQADLKAVNYRLSNLAPFLNLDPHVADSGRLDADVHFRGSFWAPTLEARARVYNGWIGKHSFKAMDLNLEGVYPTVRLTNSRILLEDGSVMRFADRALECSELAKTRTYEVLVSDAQQDTVVWGDWAFSRTRGINDKPEFLMQRVLSDRARVQLRNFDEERKPSQTQETAEKAEVGFEYRLEPGDSVKVGVRENEEFVGVEHKSKF